MTPLDPRLVGLFTRVSVGAGAATAALGVVVLVGWLFDLPRLTSILPGLATMKANTAAAFALTGAALCALAVPRPGWLAPRIARGIAALVAAGALATLSQDVAGWGLGIDELLMRDARAYLTKPLDVARLLTLLDDAAAGRDPAG
jgi:hypothetical protein